MKRLAFAVVALACVAAGTTAVLLAQAGAAAPAGQGARQTAVPAAQTARPASARPDGAPALQRSSVTK